MSNSKKQNGINPVAAAVTGAIVGAGVAVAGIAAMDEKNQKKVKTAIGSFKDSAVKYVEGMKIEVKDVKSEAKEKVARGAEKVKKQMTA